MAADDLAERLADRLADRLGRAVVVYDTDLRLVAFSEHAADVDPVRASIILARRASPRARQMIRASGVRHGHRPVRIPRDDRTGAPARVTFPLWREDRLLGYVAYLDDAVGEEVPEEQHRALLEVSGELAALLEHRRRLAGSAQHGVADLLGDLLSGDDDRRVRAGGALLTGGFLRSGPAYRAVVVARRGVAPDVPGATDEALADGLAGLVRLRPGSACGAVLGTRAVAVVSRALAAGELAAVLSGARDGLVAGIGGPRLSPQELASSHREAEIASRGPELLPTSYPVVAAWPDLGVDRLLLQLPAGELTADDLPPAVNGLLRTQRGRALVTTLDCYLDCGGDAQEAARRLTIHRSTLYYRLDRVRELTGADLADGRTRRELHVGLRVAALIGVLAEPAGPPPG
jgi:hypothetical protein